MQLFWAISRHEQNISKTTPKKNFNIHVFSVWLAQIVVNVILLNKLGEKAHNDLTKESGYHEIFNKHWARSPTLNGNIKIFGYEMLKGVKSGLK